MRIKRVLSKRLLSALHLGEGKLTVGGQAVIEGVMMRAPRSLTVAVRKAKGEIAVQRKDLSPASDRFPFLKLPLFRGVVALAEALVYGISALNYIRSIRQCLSRDRHHQGFVHPETSSAASAVLYFHEVPRTSLDANCAGSRIPIVVNAKNPSSIAATVNLQATCNLVRIRSIQNAKEQSCLAA